jgi:hypothetical protein
VAISVCGGGDEVGSQQVEIAWRTHRVEDDEHGRGAGDIEHDERDHVRRVHRGYEKNGAMIRNQNCPDVLRVVGSPDSTITITTRERREVPRELLPLTPRMMLHTLTEIKPTP